MKYSYSIPAGNSIGLLRYLLAAVIVVHHVNVLLGKHYPLPFGADIAVYAFFALSGCFMVHSYRHRSSARDFVVHRLYRLLPAYFAVVLVSAFALAPFSTCTVQEYFLSSAWWKYLTANLSLLNFLSPDLPGVFTENAQSAVNGPLWYVKVEVAFTLLYPLLVFSARWLQRHLHRRVITFENLIAVLWLVLTVGVAVSQGQNASFSPVAVRYVHYVQMFLLGILFSLYFPLLKPWKNFLLLLCGMLVLLGITSGIGGNAAFPAIRFLSATAVVIVLLRIFMIRSPFSVLNRNNLSYSIYLCHVPLVQLVGQQCSGWYQVPLVLFAVACAAPLLYFGVERKFHG